MSDEENELPEEDWITDLVFSAGVIVIILAAAASSWLLFKAFEYLAGAGL